MYNLIGSESVIKHTKEQTQCPHYAVGSLSSEIWSDQIVSITILELDFISLNEDIPYRSTAAVIEKNYSS
jgi:hypothetical protein